MILINNSKAKVRIHKEDSNGNLLREDIVLKPGEESKTLTREQIASINSYIVFFRLTVKEGGKEQTFVDPKKQKPKEEKPPTIIPGQEIVEDPEEETVNAEFVSSFVKEDLEKKTAAELRALCRQNALLMSGTREILIKRLLQDNTDK